MEQAYASSLMRQQGHAAEERARFLREAQLIRERERAVRRGRPVPAAPFGRWQTFTVAPQGK